MFGVLRAKMSAPGLLASALPRVARRAVLFAAASAALAGCTGNFSPSDLFSSSPPPQAAASQQPAAIGTGGVKVALILPLTASGNAGLAAQSMKNAGEMALAEFNAPNIQLLVKDDGGTAPGAQQAAQQALEEGAQIILGPLFAYSVGPVGQAAKARGIPVIAFSTDANVASRGVYLLSFLPESDVERVIGYAASTGKRSFAALLPDNAYGTVVEAAFKQAVAKRGGRVIALERYPADKAAMAAPARRIAQAASKVDAIFIPDGGDAVPAVVDALVEGGVNTKKIQLLGTGLWEDPRLAANASVQGGVYAAPDNAGYQSFVGRYRARFGQDPVRTATLAYDAVALIAALVKTQGPQGINDTVLTNASGFAGIDGVFRFRQDGTNERGLAILRVTPSGGQVVSPPPKTFGSSGT
jgi:branched-chain amino acid transport system substrate-binding protein